jgi:hypothetical protein
MTVNLESVLYLLYYNTNCTPPPPSGSFSRTIPTYTSSEMMLTTAQSDMQFLINTL